MARRKLIVLAATVLAALIPFPYLASPHWKVRVVDESGKPDQGALVRLSYTNYSVESDGHEEDLRTNTSGEAEFTSHTRWAGGLQWVVHTVLAASAGTHANFGRDAHLSAFSGDLSGDVVKGGYVYPWSGHPSDLDSVITLNR